MSEKSVLEVRINAIIVISKSTIYAYNPFTAMSLYPEYNFFTLIPRFCQQQKYLCARQLISNADVVKAGGLQSQDVKGEIVVSYLDPLTTQDLKSSGYSRLKGKQLGKIDPIL